jgi:hypothetical protein
MFAIVFVCVIECLSLLQAQRQIGLGGKLSVLLKSWTKSQRLSSQDQLTGHKALSVENLVSRCTDFFLDRALTHLDECGGFDVSG